MNSEVRSTKVRDILEKVESAISKFAYKSEDQRVLAPEIVDALVEAGVMRCTLPASYGGAGLTAHDFLELIEGLARLDATTSWVVTICAGIASFMSLYPDQTAKEIFDDPKAVTAGAWFPPGAAEPVQGGYRISGHWAFSSGSTYATWLTGMAMVMENGAPRIGPSGMPESLIFFVPVGDAQLIDNWDTLGMRGTGSNDFSITDAFVPEHHAWQLGPWTVANPEFNSPMFRLGPNVVPPVQAAVTLGMAAAAIDDLLTLATTKTPSYTMTGLADKPVVQDKIARARALVEAGRSYIYSAIDTATETLLSQPKLSIEQGIPLSLAGSFGIDASVQAIDLVHSCAGTSGIRNSFRFQQYFRDVHTLSQHAFSSAARYESVGKLMLGKESDWPFYYV